MAKLLLCLPFLLLALGCKFGQIKNANDVEADSFNGEAIQKEVGQVDGVLNERIAKGEIDPEQKKQILQDFVREQLGAVVPSEVPDKQAWRYGDLYRMIEDWKTMDQLYTRAVETASTEDRRVNDTLRLAEAKARQGDVEKGIELVRSTFTAAPGDKAPILMATLYEFAPAALGQDHDLEVAQLLEDAMAQHLMTYVDPTTDVGKAFLNARSHHINAGWDVVLRIYNQLGDQAAMRAAIERADKMMSRFAAA